MNKLRTSCSVWSKISEIAYNLISSRHSITLIKDACGTTNEADKEIITYNLTPSKQIEMQWNWFILASEIYFLVDGAARGGTLEYTLRVLHQPDSQECGTSCTRTGPYPTRYHICVVQFVLAWCNCISQYSMIPQPSDQPDPEKCGTPWTRTQSNPAR